MTPNVNKGSTFLYEKVLPNGNMPNRPNQVRQKSRKASPITVKSNAVIDTLNIKLTAEQLHLFYLLIPIGYRDSGITHTLNLSGDKWIRKSDV